MTNPQLANLKELADQAKERLSPSQLDRAFELFSQETARLEGKFQQVNTLLKDKVLELDAVTHYLNRILDHMTQGLLFVGFDGVISTFNRAAETILNRSAGEVLFKEFWDSFPDEAFGFSLRNALVAREAPELAFATHEGRELEVSAKVVLEQPGVILLLRDITEIRRLQSRANRQDRMQELGQMAAFVAHEIRNPLGGIRGFASLLVRDLVQEPHLQNMAKQIVEGADVLNRLVDHVLHYARPLTPQFQTLDLAPLLREVLDLMRHDSRYTRYQFHLEDSEQSLRVTSDKDLLKGALLNLLINAVEAMPEGGTVTISLASVPEGAEIAILDQGIGIPSEDLEKIFSPFFTTKHNGNGFGLTEVHKAVEALGGSLDLRSTLGQGSCFTLSLPAGKPTNKESKGCP